MPENTKRSLKDVLFETLEGLLDKSIDPETAKAISHTAQTILNAAKVEMDFARLCEKHPDNWLSNITPGDAPQSSFPPPSKKGISHPKPGVTVHRMT